MTAKELIEQLSQVAPDTEIVGGMFNGRTNTYTVLDELHVFGFDDIYNDFFGTPGAFDDKLMTIKSKDVVYLGSLFESLDKRVMEDRGIIWQKRKAASKREQCRARMSIAEREQARPKVKLYHASTIRVEHPDVQHSRPNLDFGGASLPW